MAYELPPELAADGIPCRVIDDTVALEASTAENTLREAAMQQEASDEA